MDEKNIGGERGEGKTSNFFFNLLLIIDTIISACIDNVK